MTSCKKNSKEHIKHCNCTYEHQLDGIKIPCQLKGKCCECIKYHREREELPACYFTEEQEKIYDRTISFWWHSNHKCTCKASITHIDDKEVKGPRHTGDL